MSVFYKSKTLSQLPTVEVEPTQMNRGGEVIPDRIAAYMANNPDIARLMGNASTSTTSAPVTTSAPAEDNLANLPIGNTNLTFADSYALWLQSKPEAPPQRRGMSVASKSYQKQKKQYKQDLAAWEASEPFIQNFYGQQQQEEEPADRGPSPQDSDDFAERFATGQLTGAEIQRLIEDGTLSEEQVQTLIGNYQLSEDQLSQLFSQGLLTEDQIRQIIGEEVDEITDTESSAEGIAAGLTEEQVQDLINEGRLTEDQVSELISSQLSDYNPNVDLSGYLTADDLSGYATQEQVEGLEGLFQNYLTPEQLQGYLPQEGQYVTPEQLAEATANDYDSVIQGLTDQLGELETKYQDVTSQYEADAVNQQISDTKEELNNYFAAAAPSGPRTGSTSQFSSGTSFLPGGSPMASLIGSQREGQGQDAFSSYLKTFTPSYSAYNEPFTPEEYNERNQPFTGGMYNNPFTGGMSYNPEKRSMGGQVSNGIMDLTNFDTNVQPFQNAFRPNVPRN